jgi:hypothetical protein
MTSYSTYKYTLSSPVSITEDSYVVDGVTFDFGAGIAIVRWHKEFSDGSITNGVTELAGYDTFDSLGYTDHSALYTAFAAALELTGSYMAEA